MKRKIKVPNPQLVTWFDDRFYRFDFDKRDLPELQRINPLISLKKNYFASVTSKLGVINKPVLNRLRGDIGNTEMQYRLEDGQDKGSRIHRAWEIMNTGGVVLYNPDNNQQFTYREIINYEKKFFRQMIIIKKQQEMVELEKLKMWLRIMKCKIIESEKIVYSLKHREAGTMDNLIYVPKGEYAVNGREPIIIPESGEYVFDVKSGKFLDEDAEMQVAAYFHFYEEMFPNKKLKGTIICHTNAQTRTGDIPGLATVVKTRKEVEQDYSDFRAVAKVFDRKNERNMPVIIEFSNVLFLPKEITNNNDGKTKGIRTRKKADKSARKQGKVSAKASNKGKASAKRPNRENRKLKTTKKSASKTPKNGKSKTGNQSSLF